MTDRASTPYPDEQVFYRRQTATSTAVIWLAGGVIALALAAVGFVLALVVRVHQTAQQIQASRGRRTALLAGGLGLALLIISGLLAWNTRSEMRAADRLQREGVPGDAQIEQRFLAPNGVTPRLVYRITTPDGRTASRNAEIQRPFWELLAQARTVPVVYVLDDPAISRLAFGEAEERDPFKQPGIGYLLPSAGAVLALILVLSAPFLWRGWDFKIDSRSGRISIRRPACLS
jgi:hypothetical protein